MNGHSAGFLTLSDLGTESTWNTGSMFTRADLQFISQSSEVATYTDSVGLSQIWADQAFVDIVTTSSNSYTISFYNPAQVIAGTHFPFGHNGQPFVQYTVSQVGTTNAIQITSNTYETVAPNYTGASIARTATTTLTRAGTNSTNYTWALNDWNTAGVSQVSQETRTWSTSGSNSTENLTVQTPGQTAATTINKISGIYNWGQELAAVSAGSSNPVVSDVYLLRRL